MMADLFDFAVITIFAREFLEGSIIIGEYRTFIIRGSDALAPGLTRNRALSEVTLAAIAASALAHIGLHSYPTCDPFIYVPS
jgi:hypothetical protein